MFSIATSELARDLAVSALEMKEFDLERSVSPSNEVAAGEGGELTESKEFSCGAIRDVVFKSMLGFSGSG